MIYFIVPPEHRVVSKTSKIHRVFPPLSFLNCAAILSDLDSNILIHDYTSKSRLVIEDELHRYEKADYLFITTSVYSDWQCPSDNLMNASELVSKIKNNNIFLIGNHGTHFPGDVLVNNKNLKGVIRGEPELVIKNLVMNLSRGESLSKVAGLSYKDVNKEIQHNKEKVTSNRESFVSPRYDLVDLKDYYYELMGSHFAILEGARGCPYTCNFCNLSMFNSKYIKKESLRLIEEIRYLVEEKNCKNLYFLDLEFTINKPLVEEVCHFLIKENYKKKFGFKWACQTRADSMNSKIAQLMKESGCELIHFGVEAGNEDILKQTQKRTTKEKIRKGFEITKNAGIKIVGFFILGHKNESEENLKETIKFAKELNPNYATFHKLIAFPGSPLFQEFYGKGPFWNESMSEFQSYQKIEGQGYLRDEVVAKYLKKAYLGFYMRFNYLVKCFRLKDVNLLFPFFKILFKL